MRRSACGGRTRIPAHVIALLTMLLVSCGGGGGDTREATKDSVEPRTAVDLKLSSRTLESGNIHVELMAENATGLYQLSTRLTFNPLAVQPAGPAMPGTLPAENAIFYSNNRQDGYVPIAFTNREAREVESDSGTVFSLEFEQLDPALGAQFNLLQDSDFLILRNNTGGAIDCNIEVVR